MHKRNMKRAALCCAALFCACGLVCGAAHAQAAAPTVVKVEPPSWWAGHTINPVRLLVRGRNLHGARVTAMRPETSPSAVVINPAGTYLFISIKINAAAKPGDYPLQIETASGRALVPFRSNAPLDETTNFQG